MSFSQQSLYRWVNFGIIIVLVGLSGACGSNKDEPPPPAATDYVQPTPTIPPRSPATVPPEIEALPNIYSHISGAFTVRYPANWTLETEGNDIKGSVEIGNTRSATTGNPTSDDELSVRMEWSPAIDLVSADVPPDVGPLPLLNTIVDEMEDNSATNAEFSEPFTVMIGGYQAARVDGVTYDTGDGRLDTTLYLIDFGDGVAGYFVAKTPGNIDEFEPLVTHMFDTARYAGPPAINQIHPEDLLQPLYEVSHLQTVGGVYITQDSSRFLTWSNDRSVVLRDLENGETLHEFFTPTRVTTIALNGPENLVLIQPEGESITLWNLDNGELITTLQANEANTPLEGFAWSPNDEYILGWARNYSNGTSFAVVWETPSGDTPSEATILPIESHRAHVGAQIIGGVWNHTSTRYILVDSSTGTKVYDLGSEDEHIRVSHNARIFGAAWRSDDSQIATWSQDETLRLWDVETGELMVTFQQDLPVRGAVWRDDDRQILSWQVQGFASVWDAETGRQLFELDNGRAIGGAAWTPNSTYIVTWSHENIRVPSVRIWDAETGFLVTELYEENIRAIGSISPDDQQIASWSDDGIISVWNIQSGEWDFVMRHDGVNGIQWTPDGSRLVSWSTDGTVWVWDANPDVDYDDIQRQ